VTKARVGVAVHVPACKLLERVHDARISTEA